MVWLAMLNLTQLLHFTEGETGSEETLRSFFTAVRFRVVFLSTTIDYKMPILKVIHHKENKTLIAKVTIQ